MEIKSTGELMDYNKFRSHSEVFVETGSGHGDGIQRALDAGFLSIDSIEAEPRNYQICVDRFSQVPLVRMHLGKSVDVLPTLPFLNQLTIVFFLDAHVSGEASFGHKEWAAGDPEFTQDSIIRRELDIVLQTPNRHLIMIDDINGNADGLAEQYAEKIARVHRHYEFFFYDENLSGEHLYKDKILVAVPV